jgi:hypothetical protein
MESVSGNHYPSSSPSRIIAQGIVIAIIVGLICATFYSTRKPDVQDQDFGAYYRAGQAVAAGRSPYALGSHGNLGAYMYAPVFAHVVFRYFAALPYQWAARVFLAVNWLSSAACVSLCIRLVRSTNRDRFWLAVLAVLPTGTYLWANLHNGQVGTLLLLACLIWLQLTFVGRSFFGGMVLSLAVALKLYPALLLPYLLLRRDWRGLGGVAAGLLLLMAAPALFVGVTRVLPLHAEWLKFCVTTQTADQTIRTGNQSLLGVLARLPFVSDGNQKQWSADHLATLMHLYPLIVLAITAVLYGWLFLVDRHRNPPSKLQVLRDVSLLLMWMTIASPRAWTFNFASELLAGFLVAAAIIDRRPMAWLGILAMVGVLIGQTFPTNNFHFGSQWQWWAFVMQNKHFDALLFLAIVTAVISGYGREEEY